MTEVRKCGTCYGFGLWTTGDPSPVGPTDARDGVPASPCPECGADNSANVAASQQVGPDHKLVRNWVSDFIDGLRYTYAHRSGEPEAPTEDGYYWFKGEHIHKGGLRYPVVEIIECANRIVIPYAYDTKVAGPVRWEGQFWGPLVPPWETKGKNNAR